MRLPETEPERVGAADERDPVPRSSELSPEAFRDVSKAIPILTRTIFFFCFFPITSLVFFLFFLTSGTDGGANYTPQL